MPLQKGHSPEVVSANIKELVKSGYKPKQAVAISLASKRKYKKMATGGLVNADFDEAGSPQPVDSGDEDHYVSSKAADGSKLDYRGTEMNGDDELRSLNEIREDGEYYPSEVANPMEQDEARSFAAALRRQAEADLGPEHFASGGMVYKENKKLAKVPEADRFAEGGLVQVMDDVQASVGAKPEENMSDSIEDVHASQRLGEADLDHSVRDDYVVGSPKPPKDLGISEEAMEAIRQKRLRRRNPIV